MSDDLFAKVESILKKVSLPERHSKFQIEKFMVGREPTAQAQLWAIGGELQARFESVENYTKDLKDSEDNLELFEIKIERINRRIAVLSHKEGKMVDLNIRECEINIRKLQREKEALIKAAQKVKKMLNAVIEEIKCLVSCYEHIVKIAGDPKPFDDEQSQKEMWNEKLLEDFNLRMILRKGLDPEFVRLVLCLHDDSPVKKQMVAIIEKLQKQMIADRLPAKDQQPSITVSPKITGK